MNVIKNENQRNSIAKFSYDIAKITATLSVIVPLTKA